MIRSITIGDFNGDSRPDIAARTQEGLSVLLNTGGGNFSSPIWTALPYGPALAYVTDYGVGLREVAADFNADGKLDLAIRDRNEILFGVGDGTFLAPQAISGEFLTFFGLTATGDFNGDQKPDLVFFVRGSLAILLGNGDGTFRFGSTAELGGDGQLVVADFNRDGWSDLVYLRYPPAANLPLLPVPGTGRQGQPDGNWVSYDQNCCDLRVFLGRGDGTFLDPVQIAESWAGAILVADFNDDQMPDIAASNALLLSNGDGSFHVARSFSFINWDWYELPAGPAAAADLDGDGRVDLVHFGTTEGRGITGFQGKGDGTFVPANPSSFWFWENVDRRVGGIADLDGDGRPDLVTAVFGGGDGHSLPIPSGPVASSVTILLNRIERSGAPPR